MRQGKKITIDDVAAGAEVSKSTVSRVFNHDKRVSTDTAEKVFKVAEELGYHPNSIAKALSAGQTKIVAAVLPEVWQPYYSLLLSGMEDIAEQNGYNILLKRDKHLTSVINLVNAGHVDGVILRNMEESKMEDAFLGKMSRMGIPFVLIGRPKSGYPSVRVDNIGGARELAHLFGEKNYPSLLFIGGPEGHVDSIDRELGFKMGLTEAGWNLGNLKILHGDYSEESGHRIAEQVLDGVLPRAVFAANDRMALGFILCCRERGIRIPEQVAVAGFDDNYFARYITPSLTTVRQPMYEIGVQAMQLILKMVESRDALKTKLILSPDVIVRDSFR